MMEAEARMYRRTKEFNTKKSVDQNSNNRLAIKGLGQKPPIDQRPPVSSPHVKIHLCQNPSVTGAGQNDGHQSNQQKMQIGKQNKLKFKNGQY